MVGAWPGFYGTVLDALDGLFAAWFVTSAEEEDYFAGACWAGLDPPADDDLAAAEPDLAAVEVVGAGFAAAYAGC